MQLCDVNVLVYAFREDSVDHQQYKAWLDGLVDSDEAFGCSDLVLSGFVRVVTHPRIFKTPAPLADALDFARTFREEPNAVPIAPGPRHFRVFVRLCEQADAKGNLVADAYLAALAVESSCEWVTTDRDFARFPGLRWRHPLLPR